uniref:Eukaryotic translation initiation factor 2 subunit 2 n=1 Tax=Romanomermis culicivorax TaxID=13658 RepID=A0A915IEP0_ROMCU
MDFGNFAGKKKKKKKAAVVEDKVEGVAEDSVDAAGAAVAGAWPDFSYDELLERVYNIMREKNPALDFGEKRKFVIQPPQVSRIGSKKTAFLNFVDICKLLKRTPKHLLSFLLAELGTSGSIDGNNQLIIKGKFQPKHVESVLRKYIKEYVTCHTCKSADTKLEKDTRLFFLQCETCGSRCSVTTIKSGYQAVTTKRAQTRAAAP